MQGVNQPKAQTTRARINGEKNTDEARRKMIQLHTDSALICQVPRNFFQISNKRVEVDIVHPQIGEGLKYFQISEFLSLLLFFQESAMQLY